MVIDKNGRRVDDDWRVVDATADIGAQENLLVDWEQWQRQRGQLQAHRGSIGLCLEADAPLDEIVAEVAEFDLIAFHFKAFTDGRAYSNARLLKQRYSYKGEIRASGDVTRDQLFFLARCGFDSFELAESIDQQVVDAALGVFTHAYQGGADGHEPAFIRRRSKRQSTAP